MSINFAFVLAFLYMGSTAATRVVVVLFGTHLGAEPLTIGLLAATFTVFPMLCSWRIGRILDRYGPRWLFTLGATGYGCGLLLPYFSPTLTALFALSAITGLSSTFFNLSMQNLIGTLSHSGNRTRNYSNTALVISVSNMMGPMLAGLAIDRVGHALTLLGIAAALAAVVVLLAVRGSMLPGSKHKEEKAQGVREILSNPLLWPVLIASSSAHSGLDVFQIYMPVYAHGLGFSASEIGFIVAMAAAGGFVSRIVLTWMVARSSEISVLAYALVTSALCFAAVPFLDAVTTLAVIAFIFGFGLNCSQPLVLSLVFARSEEGRAGAALGVRFSLDNGVKCVGPILFGMAASAAGIGAVFWINALMLAAGAAITRHGFGHTRQHQV